MKKFYLFLSAIFMAITVNAGTLPKVELTYSGTLSDEWTTGCTLIYDGTTYKDVSVEYNGSASKLSYRIKLDKKKALIGDTKYKQWILLSNNNDATLMRNALAFEVSKQIGMEYTPQYQFVELTVNGVSAGIYQFTDRIKAEVGRACASSAEGIDWLVQMSEEGDVSSSDTYVTGTSTMPYIVMKNPDPDDYVNDPTSLANHKAAMETFFTSFFSNPKDSIDKDQFVKWYLTSEIICNYKGFSEVYAYRQYNGTSSEKMLRFGPIWDNEKGFDNNSSHAIDMSDINTSDSYEGLMIKYADHKLLRKWIKALIENTTDTWFRDAVWEKWQTLSGLKQTLLDKVTSLESSVGTSDGEEALKTYITNRFAYLDVKLAEITGNSTSGIISVKNNSTTNYNAIYSITGQRLSFEPSHGIYIKNGKKIFK